MAELFPSTGQVLDLQIPGGSRNQESQGSEPQGTESQSPVPLSSNSQSSVPQNSGVQNSGSQGSDSLDFLLESPDSPLMECSICLDDITNRAQPNVCSHSFCYHCLCVWAKVSYSNY